MLFGSQVLALIFFNLILNEILPFLGDIHTGLEVAFPLLQEKQVAEVTIRWLELLFAYVVTHIFQLADIEIKLEILMLLVRLFAKAFFEGFKRLIELGMVFFLQFLLQLVQIVRFQRLV